MLNKLYESVIKARPKKTDPRALEYASRRLELIAAKLEITVDELISRAEHSAEFKDEYLEARSLACRISLLKNEI